MLARFGGGGCELVLARDALHQFQRVCGAVELADIEIAEVDSGPAPLFIGQFVFDHLFILHGRGEVIAYIFFVNLGDAQRGVNLVGVLGQVFAEELDGDQVVSARPGFFGLFVIGLLQIRGRIVVAVEGIDHFLGQIIGEQPPAGHPQRNAEHDQEAAIDKEIANLAGGSAFQTGGGLGIQPLLNFNIAQASIAVHIPTVIDLKQDAKNTSAQNEHRIDSHLNLLRPGQYQLRHNFSTFRQTPDASGHLLSKLRAVLSRGFCICRLFYPMPWRGPKYSLCRAR